MESLFLSCAGGLESVCQSELEELGIQKTRSLPGGVRFYGNLKTIYNVNLRSRVGIRLLLKLSHFDCNSKNDLYYAVKRVNWKLYMDVNQSFYITSFIDKSHAQLRNSQYASMVAKDGVVDRFRNEFGDRPSVDKINPDIHIMVHVHHNRGTIYLDSSGTPLSKRGYRRGAIHKASLNEALAAGIIKLIDWDGKTPLYDPMCGSGTFPIEAAMMVSNYAPGLLRKDFGFTHWKNFDPTLWRSIRSDAMKEIRIPASTKIFASDIRRDVIHLAKKNADNIPNMGNLIQWDIRSVLDFQPRDEKGIIIMNPPYGIRTGETESLAELYSGIGNTLKRNCQGHTAYIFTGGLDLAKKVGLKTSRKIHLRNGPLDSRLLKYELYSGSLKQKYKNIKN
ncbi:MAG: class I SAM-dependent RNA methyltransferase [Fidelibacterota bacterium]